MTSLHMFTHTLKGTVHTFTLNIYNNLTKLRGTQVKSALKIPKFTKSIKPVNPVLPVSPEPPGLSLSPSMPGSIATSESTTRHVRMIKYGKNNCIMYKYK